MNNIVVASDVSGRVRFAKSVMMADRLIKLKQDYSHDLWHVIDNVIQMWMESHPKDWRAFVVQTEDTRNTRANKFGANKRENLRYTVDCPEWVVFVLRKLYTDDELPMNKEFWKDFWKRYPLFRVAESY